MDEYVSREELRRQACCIYSYGGARYVSLAAIEKMEAADVAPVVHGHWDDISESRSVCGTHWAAGMIDNAQDWGYFDPMPAYCPYCGAKMDKEA